MFASATEPRVQRAVMDVDREVSAPGRLLSLLGIRPIEMS